jgi:hypothetical protein
MTHSLLGKKFMVSQLVEANTSVCQNSSDAGSRNLLNLISKNLKYKSDHSVQLSQIISTPKVRLHVHNYGLRDSGQTIYNNHIFYFNITHTTRPIQT